MRITVRFNEQDEQTLNRLMARYACFCTSKSGLIKFALRKLELDAKELSR